MKNRKHILIIRPGALGDTLILLPGIYALKSRYPIAVAGRRPGIELLAPHVAQYFDMDASVWHRLFLPNPGPGALPPKQAELVVCFMADPTGLIFNNLKRCYPNASVFLFPSLPSSGARRHVAQYVAECLQVSGIGLEARAVLLNATEKALLIREDNHPRPYLVLHPGSGSIRKNYSIQFWLAALREVGELSKNSGLRPVLLLGPAERQMQPELSEQCGRYGFQIIKEPSTLDLLALMNRTKVFVGHDSGVSHVAAMAGAGTIALFKASDPILWRPLGPRVAVIEGIYEEKILLARLLECLAEWL